MEAKASPEKDKFGKTGVLVWLSEQNVVDLQQWIPKLWQDRKDKDDDEVKRMDVMSKQIHEIWKVVRPS
jgi:hypothetical protein